MRNKIIACLIKYSLKLLLLTCRIRVTGLQAILKAHAEGPLIILLWHNRLALVPEMLAPLAKQIDFTAFVSKSRDGEILSQLVLSYQGGHIIRVPHTGRAYALKLMIETLKKKEEILIITPDGPRGPVYQLKPGVFFAAKETDAQLITFTWSADKFYELKTWDRFRIPRPFSRIDVHFGAPIHAKDLANESDLQNRIDRC